MCDSSSLLLSPQTNYDAWRQQGLENLRKQRGSFISSSCKKQQRQQDGDEDSIQSVLSVSSSLGKRKMKDNHNNDTKRARHRDPQKQALEREKKESINADDMSNESNMNYVESDTESLVESVATPVIRGGGGGGGGGAKKTFAKRAAGTMAARTSWEFTVSRPSQVLALLEGLVVETTLYTVKDYKRNVILESRYQEAPEIGRYAQVSSSLDFMAQGQWIVRWENGKQPPTMDDLQGRRLILRNKGTEGLGLPNRLPSAPTNANDDISIKVWNPGKTRMSDIASQRHFEQDSNFYIGSLSVFATSGFDTHLEMQSALGGMQNSLLSNAPWKQAKSPPPKGPRQPPLWTIDNATDDMEGITLLCAISPDEKLIEYQIRLAVDEIVEEVIGVDVIFIGEKTILSPTADLPLTKSILRQLKVNEKTEETSLGSNMDLDTDGNSGQFPFSDEESSENYQLGDLAEVLNETLKSMAADSSRNHPSGTTSPATSSDGATTIKVANRRVTTTSIRPLVANTNPNVPGTVTTTKPTETTVSRPNFCTVQKDGTKINDRHGDDEKPANFPLITPFAADEDDATSDQCLSESPRRLLDNQFETMSTQMLNLPPLKVHQDSEVQVHEDLSQASGLPRPSRHEDAVLHSDVDDSAMHFDFDDDGSIDGAPLSPNKAIVQHGKDKEEDPTLLQQLHVLMHDVFFGYHDETSEIEYGKDEAAIGAIPRESLEYETSLGYIWFQWFLPMLIMMVVTLPVAHFLLEHTREMEMLQEPQPTTWTEWFYSMFYIM